MVRPVPLPVRNNVQAGTTGVFDHDLSGLQACISADGVMTLVGCVPCTNNVSFNLDAIDILDELALLASFVVPIAPLYECSHLAGMVRRRSTRERGRSNANQATFQMLSWTSTTKSTIRCLQRQVAHNIRRKMTHLWFKPRDVAHHVIIGMLTPLVTCTRLLRTFYKDTVTMMGGFNHPIGASSMAAACV